MSVSIASASPQSLVLQLQRHTQAATQPGGFAAGSTSQTGTATATGSQPSLSGALQSILLNMQDGATRTASQTASTGFDAAAQGSAGAAGASGPGAAGQPATGPDGSATAQSFAATVAQAMQAYATTLAGPAGLAVNLL